jgi:hypothetical protein
MLDHRKLYPSSTYTLVFSAPAVKCDSIPEGLLLPVSSPNGCMLMEKSNNTRGLNCNGWIPYLSWVLALKNLGPFGLDDAKLLLPPRVYHTEYNTNYIGGTKDGPATVFLASRSLSTSKNIFNWDVLSCSLYNASYIVSVTSDSNNRGVLSKPNIRALNDLPFEVNASMPTTDTPSFAIQPPSMSDLALIESLNRLLVGTIWGSEWSRMGNTSYFFGPLLTVQNPGLSQTLLPFTKELLPYWSNPQPVDKFRDDPKQWTSWQTVDDPLNVPETIWFPNEAYASSTSNRSLGTAVEELFQKMTLSLFSNPAFLEDSAETVEIEYRVTQNIYAHNSRNLLISYHMAWQSVSLWSLVSPAASPSTATALRIVTDSRHPSELPGAKTLRSW